MELKLFDSKSFCGSSRMFCSHFLNSRHMVGLKVSPQLCSFEVTEDFSCPFCLVKCASYKGLRHHLPSSHDLFNFKFWVNEEYQAVTVSVNTDQWRSEIVADGVDPKQHTFFFCPKPLRRIIPKSLVQNAKHVHPLVLDSDLPTAINGHWEKIDVSLPSHGNLDSYNCCLNSDKIKCYMQQLLRGLEHCHSRGVLHRDIKGSNLLIGDNGNLKIADFGLANFYHINKRQPLTSRVVTLWYRPPELLLGAINYGVVVDLWSSGCILAELYAGKPIMPGRTEDVDVEDEHDEDSGDSNEDGDS